jgi:clan AA aspartic protease (TIGR02281 family)
MTTLPSKMIAVATVLILVASASFTVGSNGNKTADLDLLLEQRNYLQLERVLASGAILSPEDRALFAGVMANRRNRAGESIKLLQPLIPALTQSSMQHAVIALNTLADDYEKTYQYAAAADTYANLTQNFQPYMSPEGFRKAGQEAQRWNLLRNAPAQSLTLKGSFVVETTRNRLGLLETTVTIGGQSVRMILDTGANLSAISRSLALRLGLKLSSSEATIEGITGDRVMVHAAVIPELEIGKATFHNVPVIVAEDKDLVMKPLAYTLPGSLGFPVLSALGRITFFADHRFGVGLPVDQAHAAHGNLFLQRLTPVVAATIGGKKELFTIDTGAEGSFLSVHYYNDHPHEFDSQLVDELELTGAGGTREIPAYYAHQAQLRLAGACVRLQQLPVLLKPRGVSDDYFYGNLGQSALRQFSSYTFDFKDMSFIAQGPPCSPSN